MAIHAHFYAYLHEVRNLQEVTRTLISKFDRVYNYNLLSTDDSKTNMSAIFQCNNESTS